MRMIKLRVFLILSGERRDRVVEVDGNTKVWMMSNEVRRILKDVLGHDDFKVTGVQLYPHWRGRDDA